MPFPKPCARCEKKFQPATRSQKICYPCREIMWKERPQKRRKKKLKPIEIYQPHKCLFCKLRFRYKIACHRHMAEKHREEYRDLYINF